MNYVYRVRQNWRGKLILQIGYWFQPEPWMKGAWIWSDATARDISMYPPKMGFR